MKMIVHSHREVRNPSGGHHCQNVMKTNPIQVDPHQVAERTIHDQAIPIRKPQHPHWANLMFHEPGKKAENNNGLPVHCLISLNIHCRHERSLVHLHSDQEYMTHLAKLRSIPKCQVDRLPPPYLPCPNHQSRQQRVRW